MKLKKLLLNVLGLLALVLGVIGIVLPILPTTPFVILAAACFSVSSPKLLRILEKNRYFGSYLENYRKKTGVPRKVKIRSILVIWISLIVSMILVNILIIYIILTLIGAGVTIHIISLKNR